MIAQCEKCKSKFRIDDAKVPAAGLKVRCTKCMHIFFLKKEPQLAKEPQIVELNFDSIVEQPARVAPASQEAPKKATPGFDFSSFETKSDFSVFETRKEPVPQTSPATGPGQGEFGAGIRRGVSPTSIDFGARPDFSTAPSSAARPVKHEVVLDDQGPPKQRGLNAPKKSGQELVAILDERGLTDEYVVQKVHEVCEATRNVEGLEKPDWHIRVIGIDMLCKIKGMYKPEKKDDNSNKQLQIVTGINMKDLG